MNALCLAGTQIEGTKWWLILGKPYAEFQSSAGTEPDNVVEENLPLEMHSEIIASFTED